MRFLDLTLPTSAENLALDEALLEMAEASGRDGELLRLWEMPANAVVLGRASRFASEARVDQCAKMGVSIERRASGGTAVVVGPGCLLYSLILSHERPELRGVDQIHRFVLSTLLAGLRTLLPDAGNDGSSDLTWRGRKISGNSLRVKRSHILYHGTLLYDFPLELVTACLHENPPRQPDYRAGRSHAAFVGNAPLSAGELRRSLQGAWGADETLADWPRELTAQLTAERYSQRDWIERL